MKTLLRTAIAAFALLSTAAQADSKAVEAALKTALPTIKPDAMSLSIKTVSSHKSRIQDKLQLPNLAALVRFGIENGLDEDDVRPAGVA